MEIKHVGRLISTRRKCLVAYRTLPGESNSCLVISTENLPDAYHDSLINLVESPAGQAAYEFAEALDRMTFPDGSRMLPALHTQGRLVKVPTNQVEMIPNSSVSILLSELNQLIAEQRGVTVDDLALINSPSDKPEVKETKKVADTKSVSEESVPTSFDSPESEAKFYRSQADKLAKQAAEFRRKAEELAPTKRPVKT